MLLYWAKVLTDYPSLCQIFRCYKKGKTLRAVPDENIWGSLKAKHYIFVGLVGVSLFFNPLGGCLS